MSKELINNLKKSIIEYDTEKALYFTEKALKERINPELLMDILTEGMRIVGDNYGKGIIWLPDLMLAANTMEPVSKILEKEIQHKNIKMKNMGVIVIGTVYGDIHNIGKTMVAIMLKTAGFKVIDLGVNVSAECFIDAVKTFKPNVIAMSALLTTTAQEQRKVMNMLEKENLKKDIKVIVGGGPITLEFAHEIGADGYSPTAPGSVKVVKDLLGIKTYNI